MSNDKTATLYVSNVQGEGWTKTKGTDNQAYWYLFDGGEGGGEFRGKGHEKSVEFVVNLDADKDYAMSNVSFRDAEGQLSFDEKKSNHKRVVIDDANTGFLEAYYLVTVSRNGVDIPCDPMIKNDPKAF
jgi:hypothetical protein